MARSAFFDQGDWSQLFANLYFQQQADIDRLAQKAVARSKAEQDAEDADTYDRWRNGEISDDEWLAYIRQRIVETADDPEAQAEWRKTLREHEDAIADNQAEFAYQNGGSIHQLIAYYEDKLRDLDPGSQRYREVALRLNELKDKRDSEDLELGAEDLIDRIDRGQATLDDLLDFYRGHLRKLRPNSDLYKQVQDEIEKVEDQKYERQLGAELERIQYQFNAGQISGAQAAAQIRSIANRFKTSDPQKYYEYLNAALQYEQAGGVSGGGGGSRGGGGGGGTSDGSVGGGRWNGGFATQEDINATRAALNRIDAFNKQIQQGATEVIDIETGEVIPVTDQFLVELDSEALALYEQLNQQYLGFVDSRGRHKPKEKEASQALEDRSNYIVKWAQPHNAIPVQRQAAALLNDTSRNLNAALQGTDPLAAERIVEREAHRWRRFVDNLNTEVVQNRAERPADQDTSEITPRHPGFRRERLPIERHVSPEFAAELSTMPDFLEGLLAAETPEMTGPLVDQFAAAWSGAGFFDAQLAEELANAVNDVRARRIGLENGDLTWGVAPDAAGNLALTLVPLREVMGAPTVDEMGNVVVQRQRLPDVDYSSLGEGVQITEIYVDINGKPTRVLAPMVPTQLDVPTLFLTSDLDMPDGSVIKAGPINSREWARINSAFGQGSVGGIEVLKANDRIKEQPGIEGWYQVLVPAYTDDQGRKHKAQTWAFLPGVGWFRGTLPLRGIQRNPDGSLKLDEDGNPIIDRRGFAHRAAVPIPYEGFSPAEMQRIYDELVAKGLAPQFFRVGPDGSLIYEPADFSDAYWDPKFADRMDLYARTRETWWDPGQRQLRMDEARRKFDQPPIPKLPGAPLRQGTSPSGIPLRTVLADMSESLGIPMRAPKMPTPTIPRRQDEPNRFLNLPEVKQSAPRITTPKIQQPIPSRQDEVNRRYNQWVAPTPRPSAPRTTRTTTRLASNTRPVIR